jgi:hypothetical protein
MAKRFFTFELDGKQVLGFDTGLDAQAFAQAKMAQFITQRGVIVCPDGRVETWKADSVTELAGESGAGIMVIQGPFFPGESLDSVLRDTGRRDSSPDESLDAVRFWLKARQTLQRWESEQSPEEAGAYFPGAAGALLVTKSEKNFPRGTILFPPERLVKRCIEAEGDRAAAAAQQWRHPDLRGDDEIAFSAGIMLYTVFTGALPFIRDDSDTIRQDMREGVYMPPELAAPGLDINLAKLINDALLPVKKIAEGKKRPSPSEITASIGNAGGPRVSSRLKKLSEAELAKIEHEREQYKKTRGMVVKTRRFVIRNTTIITACAAALLALGLGVGSYVKGIQDRPNTIGMTPAQVAETYYGAFDTMDHALMEACVINKAGKGDIDMVTNLFVITKVRQAYESTLPSISPQDWLDAGSPETDITIFGVTGLRLAVIEGDESSGEVSLRADYTLWMPGSMIEETEELTPEELMSENPPIIPPARLSYPDELTLSFHQNAWRISAIDRNAEY